MPSPTNARALFASNLKKYRDLLGVSQRDLSFYAGLARNTVGFIENKAPSIHLDTLHRLSISLDIDPCSLLSIPNAANGRAYRERDLPRIVAAKVKSARDQLGMTQEMVAVAAGLAPSYVYKVESLRVRVTLDTLEAIAKALDLPPWQLLA
jgi:transcriptional regulator with XRE-family HTH domain